ncbi:MAG TPA: methyltransferase [Candidatus Limnocylindria bacterium]
MGLPLDAETPEEPVGDDAEPVAQPVAGWDTSNPHVTGEYLRRNPGWHVHTSAWKAGEILQMLDRHHLAPRVIGEVGCGAGEVLRQLQTTMDPECRFIGWDIAPDAIRLASTRANDRLQFELADVTAIETPPLDLMLILEVVDHVEDYFGFLRALQSRSTHKIFHFSLDLSVQNALRGGALLRQREKYVHLHYFNKETALKTLEETGYEVVDWFYTPYGVLFPGGRFNSLVVGPLRRLMFWFNQDLAVRVLGGYRLMVLAR